MQLTLEEELGFDKELGQYMSIRPSFSKKNSCDIYVASCPYCANPLNLYQSMNGLSVPIEGDDLVFLFCSDCKESVSDEAKKNKTEIIERSWRNLSNYRSGQRPYAVITKSLARKKILVRAFHEGFHLPVLGVKPSRVPIKFVMTLIGVVFFLDVQGGVA